MKIRLIILGGSLDGTYDFADGYQDSARRTPQQVAWGYANDCRTLPLGQSIVAPSLRALEQSGDSTECYCLTAREVIDGVLTIRLQHRADRSAFV